MQQSELSVGGANGVVPALNPGEVSFGLFSLLNKLCFHFLHTLVGFPLSCHRKISLDREIKAEKVHFTPENFGDKPNV